MSFMQNRPLSELSPMALRRNSPSFPRVGESDVGSEASIDHLIEQLQQARVFTLIFAFQYYRIAQNILARPRSKFTRVREPIAI